MLTMLSAADSIHTSKMSAEMICASSSLHISNIRDEQTEDMEDSTPHLAHMYPSSSQFTETGQFTENLTYYQIGNQV